MSAEQSRLGAPVQRAPANPTWLMLAALALSSLACTLGIIPVPEPIFSTSHGVQGVEVAVAPTQIPALPTETPIETSLEAPILPTSMPAATISAEAVTPAPTLEPTPLPTVTPTPEPIVAPTPAPRPTIDPESNPVIYYTQSGDSLFAVALRFGVDPATIISPESIPETGLISPEQLLIIPHGLVNTTAKDRLLPDSELIFSATAVDFDTRAFVEQAGGYLSTYQEWLGSTEWTAGWEVIDRVALDNSISPRILLAILEYQSGWVYGQPVDAKSIDYPLGYVQTTRKGLYGQLTWAVNRLSSGYYGWREGQIVEIDFGEGVTARIAPELNAGTVALQFYFASAFDIEHWVQALDPALEEPSKGLMILYHRMFGDPWLRAQIVEPLFPAQFFQPPLILPFFIGQMWSFTGGPHGAWEHEGSYAALDFAPGSSESGCQTSNAWALAAAPGLVLRSGNGVVVIDLDGDGNEQTGWALLYLHVARNGRIAAGTQVETGDLIGHPSCEGGTATGTHIHIARKYNGEWIAAGGAVPFTLSGWVAQNGSGAYKGTLVRGDEIIFSSVVGSYESRIIRLRDDP